MQGRPMQRWNLHSPHLNYLDIHPTSLAHTVFFICTQVFLSGLDEKAFPTSH